MRIIEQTDNTVSLVSPLAIPLQAVAFSNSVVYYWTFSSALPPMKNMNNLHTYTSIYSIMTRRSIGYAHHVTQGQYLLPAHPLWCLLNMRGSISIVNNKNYFQSIDL